MRPRYVDLFRRMRDPNPELADAAYDAVLFDRHEAVPDLVECFEKSRRDGALRFLCVQLLGFSGAADGVPTLIAALADEDARVRAEACRSLEDLGAVEAIDALRARIHDVDPDVRESAHEALLALEAALGAAGRARAAK